MRRDTKRERPERQAGFSLVEVLVTAAVLSVGACAVTAAMIHGMAVGVVNSETQEAQEAARRIMEQISLVPVREAFPRFNSDQSDDPDTGVSLGDSFTFATSAGATLEAQVLFPTAVDKLTATTVLREDLEDPGLGLPRDLNADGTIDSADRSADYVMLPVRIRVTWKGVTGTRAFEMCSVLLDR